MISVIKWPRRKSTVNVIKANSQAAYVVLVVAVVFGYAVDVSYHFAHQNFTIISTIVETVEL